MLERREQIRTQASFFLAHNVQVSAFQQQRKKTLSEIFCFFGTGALSPHETINWWPISAAKFFKCGLRCGCWTLCLQHQAPMRGGKRRAAISASANRGQ